MRINDIINEAQISEIPVGIGSRLATAAKAINPFSTSGSSLAQGSQISNKKANELYAAYYKWIGERNMPTDAESVESFLTSIRAPAAAIQAAKLKLTAAPVPAASPAVAPTVTPESMTSTLEAAPGAVLDKKIISAAFLAAAQAYGARPTTVAAPAAAGSTAPATTPAGSSVAGAAKPGQPATGVTLSVGQINAAIPKLKTRDLNSVKKTVDTAIAGKTPQPAAPAAPVAAPASTTGLNVISGGRAATVETVIFHSKFLGQEI